MERHEAEVLSRGAQEGRRGVGASEFGEGIDLHLGIAISFHYVKGYLIFIKVMVKDYPPTTVGQISGWGFGTSFIFPYIRN